MASHSEQADDDLGVLDVLDDKMFNMGSILKRVHLPSPSSVKAATGGWTERVGSATSAKAIGGKPLDTFRNVTRGLQEPRLGITVLK